MLKSFHNSNNEYNITNLINYLKNNIGKFSYD